MVTLFSLIFKSYFLFLSVKFCTAETKNTGSPSKNRFLQPETVFKNRTVFLVFRELHIPVGDDIMNH